MSPGKLAAQCSHASLAFITAPALKEFKEHGIIANYLHIDIDIMREWICGKFTKIICSAKNKYQLLKVVTIAESLGLKEGKDFFLIKDACLTELEPEELDEQGAGRTLTCIGFRPLPDDVAAQISKKYELL